MTPTVPETVTIPVGNRQIRIELGELILPGIVLTAGVLYYFGTRGLPDLSMQYAGPLMYITMALAVVTIAEHAIRLDGEERTAEDYRKQRQTQQDQTGETQNEFYSRRSALWLVVLTVVYLIALTQLPRLLGEYTFIPPTALFLGATVYLFGERRWVYLLVYAIGFTLLVWGVFVHWLKVPI